MTQQEDASKQPTKPDSQPPHEYGAALMEAVRRQPRGFGNVAPRSEAGPTRPTARGGAAQTPATRPTPMPKRPKGRLLVGLFLVLICGAGATTVWNSVFRYQAYGAVKGRIVELSAPWGGVLETVHVREGEVVLQGQLLATLVNPELDRRIAAKTDELRIAQAKLDSRISQLRYQAEQRAAEVARMFTEYKRLRGDLRAEQERLVGIVADREQAAVMVEQDLVTQKTLQDLRVKERASRAKIEELADAATALEVDLRKQAPDFHDQLQPDIAAIEATQNEINRLRATSGLGEIRTPVNGRVINVQRFTGEYSDPEFPIFELVVDGSIEAVLYVSQKHSAAFSIGQTVELDIPPEPEPAKCVVVRIADRYEPVPKNIELHYRREEKLLPVYLRPVQVTGQTATLRLGSEVRLPYQLASPFTVVQRLKGSAR